MVKILKNKMKRSIVKASKRSYGSTIIEQMQMKADLTSYDAFLLEQDCKIEVMASLTILIVIYL